MYETCILNEKLQPLRARFDGIDVKQLAEYTPLIYINWFLTQNQGDNLYWVKLFSENIYGHKPLPRTEYLKHALPFDQDTIEAWKARVVRINDVLSERGQKVSLNGTVPRPTAEETARRVMERPKTRDLVAGPEQKHKPALARMLC